MQVATMTRPSGPLAIPLSPSFLLMAVDLVRQPLVGVLSFDRGTAPVNGAVLTVVNGA